MTLRTRSTPYEQKLMKSFGKRIAEVRKSAGLTQQQLAEEIDMSIVKITSLETGKSWLRIGTLAKIAKTLKVDMSDLLKIS
jgi:transcriptional regulator with XRE-family HTH domain